MRRINSGSGLEYRAVFKTAEGNLALPATAHWRLLCRTTKQVLQDWVQATLAGSETTIDLPGSLNAIKDPRNSAEIKELQVVAAKGTDREYSLEPPFQYEVRNSAIY